MSSTSKYFKFFRLTYFCLILFCTADISFFPVKTCAATLEVAYPQIAGQTLTAATKLPDFVLYLFNAGMFIGFFSVFISLIIAGVMYLLSPVKTDLLADAKDRVSGAISGLLILALTYLIITTINPQLSILNFNSSQPSPQAPETAKKIPGVYFYNKSGCGDDGAQPYTTSAKDLGTALKNRINSVGIVQDSANKISYISILYENPNFYGKCLYVNPNNPCQQVESFASSASIYKYDFDPNGDGVYFYRKSYFNESGGYYKVDNSKINGIYVVKLEDLQFQNVPADEQDCVKYDTNGKCTPDGKRPPTLAGENISSIKINGNYLVLLVYFGPKDQPAGVWTSCQEFPVIGDVNKIGSQQIKWQSIRNMGNMVPNYVVIIPIQKN